MIKLNTNENPYPPSPKVVGVLKSLTVTVCVSIRIRIHSFWQTPLRKDMAIASDQVFLGVGSDDVLAIAFMTFFNSRSPVLFPDITYSFYDVWAELFQIPYERPALDEHFDLIREDYYKENGGVVIANPNAPTGVLQNMDFLRDVIEHNRDVVVIIDEAYADFSESSALELTKEYDNVLIVQTYSKSRSLAGMRIGYAMGNRS